MRALARKYLASERRNHTLEPTALVHEACLRIARIERIDWQGRTHLLAVAAIQMRRVLVEHARQAAARKRPQRDLQITLEEDLVVGAARQVELLALDEALDSLAKRSRRHAEVAELRVFAGLELPEIANILGVSERTAKRDWTLGRAWLARRLSPSRQAAP